MKIRPAAERDQPAILGLLAASRLPTDDLAGRALHDFLVAEQGDALLGVVGLDLVNELGLLRSLAVDGSRRGAGLGRELVARAEALARQNGVRVLYLLTTDADAYFSRCGYVLADRAAAPSAIRLMPQFAGLCPASSLFMSKSL